MDRIGHIIKTWLPTVIWICCIFILSTEVFSANHTSHILGKILRFLFPAISYRDIFTVHFFVRKAAHMVEFFIVSILLFRSFRNTYKTKDYKTWTLYSTVTVILVAIVDEMHQWFVASRTSSLIDVGIDITGGLLGLAVCFMFYRSKRRREENTTAIN
jgi:VanZ family protein